MFLRNSRPIEFGSRESELRKSVRFRCRSSLGMILPLGVGPVLDASYTIPAVVFARRSKAGSRARCSLPKIEGLPTESQPMMAMNSRASGLRAVRTILSTGD